MTIESFDPDAYKDKLRKDGYRNDVLDEMVEKKKSQLQKDENDFEYVMKLEQVEKSESNHLIVAGFASSGNLDWDDESINQDSLRSAWADYMGNPVLRFMHGKDRRNPDAVGRVIPEYVTSDGQTLKTEFRDGKPFIVAEISNAPDVESIRTKINEGVLKGFSIGGRANKVNEYCPKLGKNINRIFVKRLKEISIVDLPANRDGMFEVIKGCVGNNCSCEINDNKSNDPIMKITGDDYQDEYIKLEEINMSENIEMEMTELVDVIKSTVSDMVTEQDRVEKVEGYDAAIKAVQDLEARIAELEAKVVAQAAKLKAQPQKTMKSETEDEEEEEDEKKNPVKKADKKEDKDDVDKSETRVAELEAEIATLKESPLYKSEQTEKVEKTEVVETSHLGSILKAHYGGN